MIESHLLRLDFLYANPTSNLAGERVLPPLRRSANYLNQRIIQKPLLTV